MLFVQSMLFEYTAGT